MSMVPVPGGGRDPAPMPKHAAINACRCMRSGTRPLPGTKLYPTDRSRRRPGPSANAKAPIDQRTPLHALWAPASAGDAPASAGDEAVSVELQSGIDTGHQQAKPFNRGFGTRQDGHDAAFKHDGDAVAERHQLV